MCAQTHAITILRALQSNDLEKHASTAHRPVCYLSREQDKMQNRSSGKSILLYILQVLQDI